MLLTSPVPIAISDIKKEPKKLREFWNLDLSIYISTAIVDNFIKTRLIAPSCYALLFKKSRINLEQRIIQLHNKSTIPHGYTRYCIPLDYTSYDKTISL